MYTSKVSISNANTFHRLPVGDHQGGYIDADHAVRPDPNTPPLALTYTITVPPTHGTLGGIAPELLYTPAGNYYGNDTFQYTVGNGVATSTPAKVTITITPAAPTGNQPAASVNHSYTTVQNRALTVAAPGVLAGATPAGEPLTTVLVAGPSHGTLDLHTDGSFTYTPDANYTGSDRFTYIAMAGAVAGNVATVELTITPVPIVLLPNTRWYNYVRRRRSHDPSNFDTYHPKIGALIGLEINGIPTRPTILVSDNWHFNAEADRRQHGRTRRSSMPANPSWAPCSSWRRPPWGPRQPACCPTTPTTTHCGPSSPRTRPPSSGRASTSPPC